MVGRHDAHATDPVARPGDVARQDQPARKDIGLEVVHNHLRGRDVDRRACGTTELVGEEEIGPAAQGAVSVDEAGTSKAIGIIESVNEAEERRCHVLGEVGECRPRIEDDFNGAVAIGKEVGGPRV